MSLPCGEGHDSATAHRGTTIMYLVCDTCDACYYANVAYIDPLPGVGEITPCPKPLPDVLEPLVKQVWYAC